jgi:hypothetical protein
MDPQNHKIAHASNRTTLEIQRGDGATARVGAKLYEFAPHTESGTARIAIDDQHHVFVSTSSGPGVDGVTGKDWRRAAKSGAHRPRPNTWGLTRLISICNYTLQT